MKEIWKPIKNYTKLYEVSNLGRIRSIPRKKIQKRPYGDVEITVKGQIIAQYVNIGGYKIVSLRKDKQVKTSYVHRLVVESFIKNKKGNYVNHKNGIRDDNRLENLEWCDRSYNDAHKYRELYGKKRGITFNSQSKKYIAAIKYRGTSYYIGSYYSKELAYDAFYQKYLELRGVVPWLNF